jgi:hypothetical protein
MPTQKELLAKIAELEAKLASQKPERKHPYDVWYTSATDKITGRITERFDRADGSYDMRGVTDTGRRYITHMGVIEPKLVLSEALKAQKKAAKEARK